MNDKLSHPPLPSTPSKEHRQDGHVGVPPTTIKPPVPRKPSK